MIGKKSAAERLAALEKELAEQRAELAGAEQQIGEAVVNDETATVTKLRKTVDRCTRRIGELGRALPIAHQRAKEERVEAARQEAEKRVKNLERMERERKKKSERLLQALAKAEEAAIEYAACEKPPHRGVGGQEDVRKRVFHFQFLDLAPTLKRMLPPIYLGSPESKGDERSIDHYFERCVDIVTQEIRESVGIGETDDAPRPRLMRKEAS